MKESCNFNSTSGTEMISENIKWRFYDICKINVNKNMCTGPNGWHNIDQFEEENDNSFSILIYVNN